MQRDRQTLRRDRRPRLWRLAVATTLCQVPGAVDTATVEAALATWVTGCHVRALAAMAGPACSRRRLFRLGLRKPRDGDRQFRNEQESRVRAISRSQRAGAPIAPRGLAFTSTSGPMNRGDEGGKRISVPEPRRQHGVA